MELYIVFSLNLISVTQHVCPVIHFFHFLFQFLIIPSIRSTVSLVSLALHLAASLNSLINSNYLGISANTVRGASHVVSRHFALEATLGAALSGRGDSGVQVRELSAFPPLNVYKSRHLPSMLVFNMNECCLSASVDLIWFFSLGMIALMDFLMPHQPYLSLLKNLVGGNCRQLYLNKSKIIFLKLL